jgi:hypothetical protein
MPAYRPAAVVMAANTEEVPPPIATDRLGRPIIGPCRLWTKALDGKGYGAVGNRDFGSTSIQRAHRAAYALAHDVPLTDIRSIPELDHLCRVTRCCAPAHLEPVTHRENVARGDWGSRNRGKTECIRGHPFTPENTRTYRTHLGGVGRACRACQRAKQRAAYDAAVRHGRYAEGRG